VTQPIYHSRPHLGQEEAKACERVIRSKYLAAGQETERFEAELAQKFQRQHVIAVSSGMSALHLALHALGCGDQNQVLCPSYVCTALLNAIGLTRAKVKLLDNQQQLPLLRTQGLKCEAQDFLIAPQMFGLVTSLSDLPKHQVIEDCAMTLGPSALQQGIVSTTSFYATKMMTTAQGGALFTDDEGLATELRDLISYDNRDDYRLRFNYAPNDLSCAMGRVQLERLDQFIERRDHIAGVYDELLKSSAPQLLAHPKGLSSQGSGLFRYWVNVGNLEECVTHLKLRYIEAKSPVFRTLHRYLSLDREDFPNAERHHNAILSLPFYPSLKDNDLNTVIECLLQVAESPR
jgi:perosamine synthetase